MSEDGAQRVPLVRVDAEALVNDFCATVNIKQEYFNEGDHVVAVKYVFPVEEGGIALVHALC